MLNKIKKNVLKNRSKIRNNFDNLPIVSVTRSNKNLVAQLFDIITKKVIYTNSTSKLKSGTKIEKSSQLGTEFADYLLKSKIKKIIFNRNGRIYHGRVKAFAEGLRSNKIDI
jgi:large subunit ribosomal protein L18